MPHFGEINGDNARLHRNIISISREQWDSLVVLKGASYAQLSRRACGLLVVIGWVLAAGIYLLTLYIAYLTGFFQMLLTLALPGVAQVYWTFRFWYETGTFLNLLTILCIAWLVLMGLGFGLAAASERD